MSSLKMTFSLTSLILIFALVGFSLLMPMVVHAAKPVFDSTQGDITLNVSQVYSMQLPGATDADGDSITYALAQKTPSGDGADPTLASLGLAFDTGTRTLSGTAALPDTKRTGIEGTYVYTARGADDTDTVKVEFKIKVNSTVTFATTVPNLTLKANKSFEYRLPQATDSRSGSAITYTLTDITATGLAFDANLRYISGTTGTTAVAEAEYTYTATGVVGGLSSAAELKFKAKVVLDSDPEFGPETISDISGTVGTLITRVQLPTATDADGDMVVHTLTPDLPAGLTFDEGIKLIEGTPTAAMAETEYTWTATDADGGTAAMKKFKITIAAGANNAPAFATAAATRSIAENTAAGMAIGAPVVATDADGDSLTYTLSGADMASFAIVSTSGQLQTKAALDYETKTSYMVTVTASDSNGGMDSIDVTINVTNVVEAGEQAGPPTAAITVSNYVAATGNFDIRVVLTPATGGSAVKGFNHTYLTVMDSSTPAVAIPVVVEMGTTANPVDAPLMDDNLYVATLDYDTRRNPTLPLKVTIDQSMLVTANPTHAANVGTAAPGPTPAAKAKAAFSGTLNLTGQSIITVTLSKAAMLTAADIAVTGGSVGGIQAKEATATAPANTVWEVAINADNNPFNRIEVTIASTSTVAEPTTAAGKKGKLASQVKDGTLNSITPSTGADDTAVFTVTLTFAAALPAGADVIASDLKLTPTTATVTGIASLDRITWQVQIKPTKGMSTTIELSDDGKLKFNYAGAAVKVGQKTTATVDVTAAYAAGTGTTTGTTTISKGVIGANSFVVLYYSQLPDLELFFDIGGTIGLDDGDGADDKNSRTVVISEILWGLDFGEVLAMQRKHQFIELYNTTAAAIDLKDWKLVFTRGNVVPASDIDQVSNRGRDGWEVDTGDTGKSGRVTNTLATDVTSAITPINVISMYRNINYTHVETQAAKDTVDRAELVKGIPGGNAKGSWKNSELRSSNRWIYSTPGAKHHSRVDLLVATPVDGTPFRINEIGNDVSGDNDWVELHNVSDAEASLKNYALSAVTAKGTDTRLFHFHDQDWKIPAKGFIVVSTRHPSLTDLATGKDISIADEDELNKGLSHLYVVKEGWNLPDDGKFALILRSAHDKSGKPEAIEDVIAARSGAFADNEISTDIWPLKANGLPHENVIDGTDDEDFRAGRVFQRNSGNGRGEKQLALAGYTGIGYDVKAAKVTSNHGTPGYDNGAARDKKAALTGGVVTISEIMVDIGSARRNLPQWIELHNSSATEGVNLNGWKIHIENAGSANGDPQTNTFYATVTIGAKTILPNQTLLVASSTGNVRDPNHFPPTRVVNLWTTKAHRDALEMTRSTDPVLSTRGFNITLEDKDGVEIDVAGNLDGNRRTRDEPAWMLPKYEAPDGRSRSSILRVYDQKVAVDGTMEDAWILASDTILAFEVSHAYYGNADDVGSPGYRTGGPLPVSLSKFRPERMKDTGEIVVRWVTESELNNAGFNILRSDKRDGEFTKVHYIAGQGTTSERTVYEWKDKSAKPNVVYYYQIQDVSLDGDVTTLRTTHLRGNVTAAGKLTTTWAGLKALQ